MSASPSWVSLHLYTEVDLDVLLGSIVRRAVCRLERTRTVQRFFFIRYWDEGAHVRLRLSPPAGVRPIDLRAAAEDLLSDGARRTSIELTVVDRPYVPELERYGGTTGVEITEEQFHLSSSVVLELIGGGETAHERAGYAALMLLGLAAACGLRSTSAAAFLSGLTERWRLATFGGAEGRIPEPAAEVLRQKLARDVERSRRSGAFERLAEAWDHLEGETETPAPILGDALDRWLEGTRRQVQELCRAAESGRITAHPRHPWPRPPQPAPRCAGVAGVLWDWAHLSNNRLGLSNPDEVLVSHLVAAVVAERAARAVGERKGSHG